MGNIEKTGSPRVLVVFYSFSGQTMGLVSRLALGLKEEGVSVVTEKLAPVKRLRFPIGTVPATIKMMLTTLFRCRVPIKELSPACSGDYDLVILAGPTWSYNPSGPVLSFLDRDGRRTLAGKTVMPLISCRGYWRMHWCGLKGKLKRCGAITPNHIVFSHPHAEPWRTIGVFLKLAGKRPERSRFIGRFYKKFGHSRKQMLEAHRFGRQIGVALKEQTPLTGLDFVNELSLP